MIKRIIISVAIIFGSTAGFLVLGLINWLFDLNLSFGEVFGYGVVGGILVGLIISYLIIYLVIRWFKKRVQRSITNIFGFKLFNSLRRFKKAENFLALEFFLNVDRLLR